LYWEFFGEIKVNKKSKFSIYIGTLDANFNNILSTNLREKVEDGRVQQLVRKLDGFGDAIAYWVTSEEKKPKWHGTLDKLFDVPNFQTNSAAALVIMKIDDRVIVITFGYGAKLLNDYYIEHDFGVRVAVNAVAENEVSSLQKSNVANAIKQFSQSPMKANFGTFGGQGKFEIIRRLSGASEEKDIDTLVGSTGVSFTTEKGIDEIIPLAKKLISLYGSQEYKKTSFSVIDDFLPILSPSKVIALDEQLVQQINSNENFLELSVPQIRFEDVGYIKFMGIGLSDEFPDVSLDVYKGTFDNEGDISLDDLNDDKIAFYTDNHTYNGTWTVKKCLVGYVELDGARHVINEGRYYLPSESLFETVKTIFYLIRSGTNRIMERLIS